MSNGPTSDPIFEQPVAPVGGSAHEHKEGPRDWVVVHRGGENSKAHVQSLEHKLTKAGIPARISHDDDRKVVLEVPREREEEAKQVLGAANTHGADELAHQTREAKIEAEERAELHGAFKASTWGWLLVLVAIAVLVFLAMWWLAYR